MAERPVSFGLNGPGSSAKSNPNLAEKAYTLVGEMILQQEFAGGEFLVEERLAKQLNISRTPMREAILRLAAEGILVKRGNRSFAVRTVSAAEFFQSHRLRELLEPEAAELAVGRIEPQAIAEMRRRIEVLATAVTQETQHWQVDDQLHSMIAEASGNQVLAGVIKQLRATTRLFEVSNPMRRVGKDGDEHLAILDALISGDGERARTAMRTHIRNLVTDTITALTKG